MAKKIHVSLPTNNDNKGNHRRSSFWKKKIFKKINMLYAVGCVLVGIMSILLLPKNFQEVKETYRSDRENNFRENFIHGLLIPPAVLNSPNTPLIIKLGGPAVDKGLNLEFPINVLRNGADFKLDVLICKDNSIPISLKLRLVENRLLVSDSIVYLKDEEVIGWIHENRWVLFDQNKLDYYSDNSTLEVVDKQGHVALSLKLEYPNKVYLQGYFIGKNHVTVVSENNLMACLSKDSANWRQKATSQIEKIKRLHPFDIKRL